MSTRQPPIRQRRGVAAKDAPVGARVQVYGFTTPDGWLGSEQAHFQPAGTVARVETRVGEFLDTEVILDDGRMVYARSYAVTLVLT
jgi:hypothetical protein